MHAETLTFTKGRWSAAFPPLDSDATLVLAFGAPEVSGLAQALGELRAAYPRAKLVGCSSAGEIAGAKVLDASLSTPPECDSREHSRGRGSAGCCSYRTASP
jgi:hypothetical protein